MPPEPNRYKHYQTQLNNLLQSATVLIRNYDTTLRCQAPQLTVQANRIWELSQRERLVAGTNKAAAAALLSACHDAYQPIHHFINQQQTTLAELASHVTDFERASEAMAAELDQVSQLDQRSLAEWNAWLSQTLSVLQTQTKYLELHARLLLPKLVQSSTVQQFINDLELSADYRGGIHKGLAKAMCGPKLLPLTAS